MPISSPDDTAQTPPSRGWLAVVGPTGSGKSELAIALAERFGGEIVNTDSLQVYRRLDIGTAKPTPEQRARVPHHLLDVVEPDQPFSAGAYVAQARAVIARLEGAGKLPVLCGGTGLYFRALLQGMANIPPVPAAIRDAVLERLERDGLAAAHAELARVDPAAARRIHPNDPARIARGLEVFEATGTPLSAYQRRGWLEGGSRCLSVGFRWERAELYARINARVAAMLAGGLVEEVRRVLALGFAPTLKPLQSIGYREVVEYLAGGRPESSLLPAIAQRTRHYAKRQLTWFRQHPGIHWAAPGDLDGVAAQVRRFLDAG